MQAIGLPSPHGDCEPSEDYVQTKCLARCEADYVIGNCSCKNVNMPGEIALYFCRFLLFSTTKKKDMRLWLAINLKLNPNAKSQIDFISNLKRIAYMQIESPGNQKSNRRESIKT